MEIHHSGEAFSMYFSPDNILSETPPKSATWENTYKIFVSGKSIKEIRYTGDSIIATSTPEPMIASVLRIDKNGDVSCGTVNIQKNHGEITDIAVSNDGFFMSGHKGNWENG